MSKIVTWIWRLIYIILFRCARAVFWITRTRIRGAMVAIWYKGRVVLVRSSYRRRWSLPGGLARKEETLAAAAAREAFEEVGIQLKVEDLVAVGTAQGDLGPHDTSHFFEVEMDGPVDIVVDGREIIYGELVTPKEALVRELDSNVRHYLVRRQR